MAGLLFMGVLGVGLGLGILKGSGPLWTLGLLASLALVLVVLARWQVAAVSRPLGQLLAEARSRDLADLPAAWSALQQENADLRERAGREEALLPGIMARLEEGVLLFRRDGTLEQYNPAAQRHLGLAAPLDEGLALAEVLPDEASVLAVRRAQSGVGGQWRLVRSARVLRARAIPFAPLGTVTGVLVTLDDVTSQEAMETTRQKFISNVSHELKTPVTAIRIAAENLVEDLPEAGRASAESILRSVDRLALLLGDLSELSRIESGALRLAPEPLDPGAFHRAALEEFRRQHGASGVLLEGAAEVPPGMEVRVDPLRLHQVLENLVSNAVKFSPAGACVRLDLAVRGGRQCWEVRDQGPGIPEDEQGRVFERFYRSREAKAKPGTGLGLAIVKHLCRLMGGEVVLESRPGQGATFRVLLPLQAPGQSSDPPPSL